MGFYDPGVPKLPCNSACFDLKSIFLGLWETCDTNSPFHVRLKLGSRSKDSFSKIPCTNQIISKSKLITEFHQILINIYSQLGATVNFFPVFPDSSSTLGNPLYASRSPTTPPRWCSPLWSINLGLQDMTSGQIQDCFTRYSKEHPSKQMSPFSLQNIFIPISFTTVWAQKVKRLWRKSCANQPISLSTNSPAKLHTWCGGCDVQVVNGKCAKSSSGWEVVFKKANNVWQWPWYLAKVD